METEAKGEKKRVIVVMPAYNASKTLEKTYLDLPGEYVDEIILVDDVSQDETVRIARKLGLKVLVHVQNKGYGGNQKTCYLEALRDGADVVVMLHPDYQYDSKRVPALIEPILAGRADLVLGSRMKDGSALAGGMPKYKYIFNGMLTALENLVLGTNCTELHTGFRAFSRKLLTTVPFLLNSDNFVFDSEMIMQAVAFGFQIEEIAVPCRYFPEASSVGFKTSTIYGLQTLAALFKYSLFKLGVKGIAQFDRNLKEIVSAYHWDSILGETKNDVRDE